MRLVRRQLVEDNDVVFVQVSQAARTSGCSLPELGCPRAVEECPFGMILFRRWKGRQTNRIVCMGPRARSLVPNAAAVIGLLAQHTRC